MDNINISNIKFIEMVNGADTAGVVVASDLKPQGCTQASLFRQRK